VVVDKPRIPDNMQSEEVIFDVRFVKRWADRVVEVQAKWGQQVAQTFFEKMFTPVTKKLINEELARRAGKGNGPRSA